MKNNYFAGIDIGGTKIAGALATANGKIISRVKSPTPKGASPAKITSIIADLLQELLSVGGLSKKNLSGVGIGIPGIIDTATGRIIRTPNMRLSGANLQKQLEKRIKISCSIDNDVNLGTLGEKWLGAAKKAKNVVGLFIGTGIGAGIIIDDKLVNGSHGAAAEIGHMIIQDDGPKCSCGNIGCLEALAGRWAIERDIRQEIKKGKKTIITKLLNKKSATIKSKVLRKALQKHDTLTIKILTAAAEQLGIACISIRHIFDPEMIVLGGGVMEACGDFILPIVKKTVQKDRFFSDIGGCAITASKLGDDAIVLGAIALAKQHD
ncbi:MAG: ROK family protein [Candidatus Omnitrophota bacterium]